jgi:DNA polymerase III delta prime subunit
VDTRRVSGQTISSTPQQSGSSELGVRSSELDKHGSEFKQVAQAIRLRLPCGIAAGNSVIVLGEAGTGKNDFALALHEEMSGEFNSAIATYKGSIKKFFVAIAMQLDCPTENEQNRPLTVDALKQEILENTGEDTLLIFPEAKRGRAEIRVK